MDQLTLSQMDFKQIDALLTKALIGFIRFNNTGAIEYNQSTTVNRVRNCNGFVATNVGTTIVRVNGHILYPGVPGTNNGDSLISGGNIGEVFLGQIQIVFDAGGAPALLVDQKFYILDNTIV